MLELKRLSSTHIISTPAALDAMIWPAEACILRIAPDEVLVMPPLERIDIDDPHAIIMTDSGYVGLWLPQDEALDFLERHCEWALPLERPAFAQGKIAGLPAKLWFEETQILFIVPAPFAADFEERLL